MATRARRAVAPLLQTIENTPNWTPEKRKEVVTEILEHVANPIITQEFLDKHLATATNGGISPFCGETEERVDGLLDVYLPGLSGGQVSWLKAQTASLLTLTSNGLQPPALIGTATAADKNNYEVMMSLTRSQLDWLKKWCQLKE